MPSFRVCRLFSHVAVELICSVGALVPDVDKSFHCCRCVLVTAQSLTALQRAVDAEHCRHCGVVVGCVARNSAEVQLTMTHE
jgi:hypothetical protein